MTNADPIDGAVSVLARLERATNAHDLNALVACFAPDYQNDTPAHPGAQLHGPRAGQPELGADLRRHP